MNSHKPVSKTEFERLARGIKLLLLDVDGVMTDGKLYFSNSGEEMKCFNTLDGHGIKMLRKSGVEVGIITGRTSNLVAKRARDLGVHLLMQGREDKHKALEEMLATHPCELANIAFLGDDYPDLGVMSKVGLSVSVANAHPEIIARSHWQTQRRGGDGAVRELCDLIMQAQGSYHSGLEAHIGE